MPKQSDDLSPEGEPSQTTEKGLKIPVPKRSDLDKFFKGIRKDRKAEDPSRSDPQSR